MNLSLRKLVHALQRAAPMNLSPPQPSQELGDIEPTAGLERKSDLLRPLNTSLIVLSLIGLVLGTLSNANWEGLSVVGISLLLNSVVAWLVRTGKIVVAAYIFTYWINLGIIYYCYRNLLIDQNLGSGVIFACALAMSVMLTGMLLGARFAGAIAIINVIIVVGLFFTYFQRVDESASAAIDNTISFGVPIAAFLIIIAVISWLYQRALAHASARLELARQRIMRDELLRRDLAVARELQQRLYPPPPLTNAAISIASRSEPARETSGDFYDFIPLADDRLGIVVADVTGKSIAAALVMAMSRSTLRSEATRHMSPAEVLSHANRTLCQDNTFKQMITAFYGVLDTRTLRLAVSNAGHPFPMLRRAGRISELEVCGLPLGAREDATYSEQIVQLQPGDQLVLISDGLLEEQNARRELFGFERMLATVANASTAEPEQALDEIWETVARFRSGAEQSDDITLVVVQVAQNALPVIPAQPLQELPA